MDWNQTCDLAKAFVWQEQIKVKNKNRPQSNCQIIYEYTMTKVVAGCTMLAIGINNMYNHY